MGSSSITTSNQFNNFHTHNSSNSSHSTNSNRTTYNSHSTSSSSLNSHSMASSSPSSSMDQDLASNLFQIKSIPIKSLTDRQDKLTRTRTTRNRTLVTRFITVW